MSLILQKNVCFERLERKRPLQSVLLCSTLLQEFSSSFSILVFCWVNAQKKKGTIGWGFVFDLFFGGLDCERKCVQTHVLLMTQMVFWNTGLVRLDSVWIGEKNYTDVVCINLHLGSLELKELLKSVSVVAPLCKSLLHVLAHFWFSYPLNTRRKTQLVGSFSVRLIK